MSLSTILLLAAAGLTGVVVGRSVAQRSIIRAAEVPPGTVTGDLGEATLIVDQEEEDSFFDDLTNGFVEEFDRFFGDQEEEAQPCACKG